MEDCLENIAHCRQNLMVRDPQNRPAGVAQDVIAPMVVSDFGVRGMGGAVDLDDEAEFAAGKIGDVGLAAIWRVNLRPWSLRLRRRSSISDRCSRVRLVITRLL